ncbi:hypothetical protein LIER_01666 [Lithospermum erythrorhizon]|uniref:Uncharacterized protein n=1 Tax=Lithospermum erythrorhizon TaxID=34254 RepID=A0AAV3NLR2_LITER
MPKDFWRSMLEPGMKWGHYPSDHEDIKELCHMYIEVEDTPEAEITSEAHQRTQEVPQSFTVTFTDDDMPEKDGDHNRLPVVGHLERRATSDSGHDIRLQPRRSTSNEKSIHPPSDRQIGDNIMVPCDRLHHL